MLFVMHAVDHPDALELRWQTRPAHSAYHSRLGHPLSGPLTGTDGKPCGTLIIFDAEDMEAAESLIADDPYVRAGVFERVDVHPFTPIDWPT